MTIAFGQIHERGPKWKASAADESKMAGAMREPLDADTAGYALEAMLIAREIAETDPLRRSTRPGKLKRLKCRFCGAKSEGFAIAHDGACVWMRAYRLVFGPKS